MPDRLPLLALAALAALVAAPAAGQDDLPTLPGDPSPSPALSGDPTQDDLQVRTSPDGAWVNLTGAVTSVSEDSFVLAYGEGAGSVAVDVGDYEFGSDDALVAGDEVTVTGFMDRDFHEARKIEAVSVYIPKLSEYFYVRSREEAGGFYEPGAYDFPVAANGRTGAAAEGRVAFAGSVTAIDGETVTVDAGARTVEVTLRGEAARPTDLRVGDRVAVTGRPSEADLFDDRGVVASSLVRLTADEQL